MKRCHQKFATWKVPRSIIRSNSYFWISHWKYVHKGQQKTTGVSTCTTIHGSIKKKKKKKKLMNAFLNSQFSYCHPLYGCVNRFHERCLRLIYNDKQLTFEEPLQKDGSISIHIRNLQALAIEMYKAMNGSSPEIMKEVFWIREENGYNLRHQKPSNVL